MSANGYLDQSELAPIAGGYLLRDAAAAFNAMNVESRKTYGIELRPGGPDSSYRPYDRQVYWKNYWCAQGHCENAATPGTSNHGEGLAIDIPDYRSQQIIAAIGARYGFQKAWSDASWEPWHFKWSRENCSWSGKDPGPGGNVDPYPILKRGDNGEAVIRAQKHLDRWNLGLTRPNPDGDFGATTRKAVVEFQTAHGLKADGIIGKSTWNELRRKRTLSDNEQKHVNLVRWYRRSPHARRANRGKLDYHRAWIARRIKSMNDDSKKWKPENRKKYWAHENRGTRRKLLKATISGKAS